ncbi:SCO2400 family protein [Streptomyces sp. CB03234]|uniref:SCO2400 family protein n=1 Tax=Streptomyces sp. (strain CB03234) TaxID=1703937 RepID=UPI000AECE94E|nr:hypothetical protein [Streptomyces sp. CB03234]
MDYCHQCQRHLNGALACAGCGTPAEELRHDDAHVSAADHVYELDRDEEYPPAGPRRARGQARRAQPPVSRRSRPAGRRARKRRGRKVLIGVVALILAAGLLSLAELAIEHPGEDGAATAVQEQDAVLLEPPPEQPEGSGRPDAPSPVDEPVAETSASGDPEDGPGAGEAESGAPSGAPGTSASARSGEPGTGPSAPQPSGDPEEPGAPDAPAPDDSAPADPPPDNPGNPGNPDEPAPDEPAPDDPPPSQPSPEPSPTESCDWFLWWCV